MKPKSIITSLLLAFVVMTLGVQVSKHFRHVEATELTDGVNVVFFHAKVRCPTCTTMEKYIHATLEKDFPGDKIKLYVLDYESSVLKRVAISYGLRLTEKKPGFGDLRFSEKRSGFGISWKN